MSNKPLVNIGMPIYNEEEYLEDALQSLLAQDYENFEIIISDNASTDATPAICEKWQKKDSRIHYYRNESNIGGSKNFNRAFELTKGEYFMWAAGHDLWQPNFISACIETMLTDARISLCYPLLQWVDVDGNLQEVEDVTIETRGYGAIKRYLRAIWRLPQNAIYGVIRRSALEETRLALQAVGPDQILLVELSQLGDFAQVRQPLFLRRRIRPGETLKQARKRRSIDLWEENKSPGEKLLHWRFVVEIISGVSHVTRGWQRIKMLLVAIPVTPIRFYKVLINDVFRLFQ